MAKQPRSLENPIVSLSSGSSAPQSDSLTWRREDHVTIIFTIEAKRDLDDLRAYLQPLNPSGLRNVTSALEARIVLGAENPSSGRQTPLAGVRELVETRYGFVIPYIVRSSTFVVLRVYRGRRRPLDYTKLTIPD
jgi:toxin ParE1/3/4